MELEVLYKLGSHSSSVIMIHKLGTGQAFLLLESLPAWWMHADLHMQVLRLMRVDRGHTHARLTHVGEPLSPEILSSATDAPPEMLREMVVKSTLANILMLKSNRVIPYDLCKASRVSQMSTSRTACGRL